MKRIATLGLALAVIGALTVLSAAVGYRTGLFSLLLSLLTLLRWGAYVGGAAVVVSAIALVGALAARKRTSGTVFRAALGLIVGGFAFGIPAMQQYQISQVKVPPIHDISTDTDDPPLYVDVLPLRANAPNPVEYGGPEVAAQQHQAYPDLKPVTLNMPLEQAFNRALVAATNMGWELVASSEQDGRIEATDTTFWFGFKDDVVIRLRSEDGGTRVDVRSLSRLGGGDVGANARRIRAYLERLTDGS